MNGGDVLEDIVWMEPRGYILCLGVVIILVITVLMRINNR